MVTGALVSQVPSSSRVSVLASLAFKLIPDLLPVLRPLYNVSPLHRTSYVLLMPGKTSLWFSITISPKNFLFKTVTHSNQSEIV